MAFDQEIRLLIIEDDPVHVEIMNFALKSHFKNAVTISGSDIETVANALNTGTIDAAIIDYHLPDNNGIEILANLRKEETYLPILMVTAAGDEEIAVDAMKAGADEYIIKRPGFEDKLPGIVERLIKVRGRERRLQAALKESEEKFRVISETAHDAIVMIDDEGKITYWNHAAHQMFGWSEIDAVGAELHKLIVPKKYYELYAESLRRFNLSGWGDFIGKPMEIEALTKDGAEISIELSISLGMISGTWRATGIMRDITERKHAEEKIRKLSRAVEQCPVSIVITDHNGNMEYVNPKFTEITGFSAEEALGKNPRILKSDEQSAEFYRDMWTTLVSGKEWKGEFHNVKKNSEHFWESAMISPIFNDDGEITHYVAVKEDITERKRQLEELKTYRESLEKMVEDRTSELSEANEKLRKEIVGHKKAEDNRKKLQDKLIRAERMEYLGLLAGGVAHDLNNILGPMIAYPDFVLAELPRNSSAIDDVLEIKRAAERAVDVIGDLLTLARRGKYDMKPLSINDVVRQYINSPSFRTTEREYGGILFEANLDKSVSNISGSASHLSKVIMNLLNNAYEAMPDGGSLQIRTFDKYISKAELPYNEFKEGHYVIMEVEDTGLGILDEDKSQIFEPFFTKKTMGKSGTGLGLSVVFGVVKDHDGYIYVDSEVGVGTKFSVYLPLTEEKIEIKKKSDINDFKGSEQLLFVDDNITQRDLARRLLSALGYQVNCASTGREALDLIQKEKFDLIILDMIMEDDFDGLDTYRGIREINENQKVIIASGFSESERIKEALYLGVNQFVKKPFSLATLGEAIRMELDIVQNPSA